MRGFCFAASTIENPVTHTFKGLAICLRENAVAFSVTSEEELSVQEVFWKQNDLSHGKTDKKGLDVLSPLVATMLMFFDSFLCEALGVGTQTHQKPSPASSCIVSSDPHLYKSKPQSRKWCMHCFHLSFLDISSEYSQVEVISKGDLVWTRSDHSERLTWQVFIYLMVVRASQPLDRNMSVESNGK